MIYVTEAFLIGVKAKRWRSVCFLLVIIGPANFQVSLRTITLVVYSSHLINNISHSA